MGAKKMTLIIKNCIYEYNHIMNESNNCYWDKVNFKSEKNNLPFPKITRWSRDGKDLYLESKTLINKCEEIQKNLPKDSDNYNTLHYIINNLNNLCSCLEKIQRNN